MATFSSSRARMLAVFLPALLITACGEQAASLANSNAVNNKGKTPGDGSLMSPGRPQLAALPTKLTVGAVQPFTWNMWWGENGRHWAVYVNGVEVESGTLTMASPEEQKATITLPLDTAGPAEIKVALCNDHGCSESEPVVVDVGAG
ncbi:MAG: chitinase N-terminal domain-containing protein [Moraxellaceae bacterium]|nr:chitinase N-terminal domain-containing protein [Moraxellaceae bacterium]